MLVEKVNDYWYQSLGTLLLGWLTFKHKVRQKEHEHMKTRVSDLELKCQSFTDAIAVTTQQQKEIKEVQTEIRQDIKTLISRTAEPRKLKRWFS